MSSMQAVVVQDGPLMEAVLTHEARTVRLAVLGVRGVPGAPGGARTVTVGAQAISGHAAVALAADGTLVAADCTDAAHLGAVLGVTDAAYAPGAQALVRTAYELAHAGWAFAPGPVYVGAAGALVQALPPGAVFSQVIGFALAATLVHVAPQPPILIQ